MLYTADFETTTKRPGDMTSVRVWAWATCSIDDPNDFTIGKDMQTFMEWIGEHPGRYYFHNLRYDGKYLVDYLFKSGWMFVPTRPKKTKQFTSIISRMGQWYSISLRMWSKTTKRSEVITIWDSTKLLPLSVKDVAKAFDLDEGKGDLDYETWRPEGHELTDEERDYIRRDVQIMAKALHICVIDENMDKMTIGGNAMKSWKKGYDGKWRLVFPKLGNACDLQIRQAYRGGFTYCMPEFKDADVYDGMSLDFNSMYPSMMISKDFPYGEPVPFEGRYVPDKTHPLYVQRMLVTWSLKPTGIPFMKPSTNGIFDDHEYPPVVDEPVDIWVSSIDLELMSMMYDIDVWEYRGGWKFCSMPGTRIFGEYVSYWGDRKAKSKGPQRLIAKLFLNNLYGKFATRPENITKMPAFDEDNQLVTMHDSNRYPGKTVDGKDTFVDLSTRPPEPVYIPIAVFCTAYARQTLLTAAMANRDRFVYCDTDSLHLIGQDVPTGIPIDDAKLGHWKIEGTFSHARHIRAKTYMWDLNGQVDVVCAGMPDQLKEKVTWENFHEGFSNIDECGNVKPGWGKLLPKTVNGGVILYEGKFEIKGDLI